MVGIVSNKYNPFLISGISGIILLAYLFPKMEIINIYTPSLALGLTACLCGVLYMLTYKTAFSKLENSGPVFSHVLDSMTTILGRRTGYQEEHVISHLIISATNIDLSFLVVKIIIVMLVVWIINTTISDVTLNRGFKGAIFVMGCYTGLRNLFNMLMMC